MGTIAKGFKPCPDRRDFSRGVVMGSKQAISARVIHLKIPGTPSKPGPCCISYAISLNIR